MPIWEVELFVYGMVKVNGTLEFRKQKGTVKINPFFSDIEIKNFSGGLVIKTTAHAPRRNLANNAALVFIGQMLDCLTIDINEPLFLSFVGDRYYSKKHNVKRVISKYDFSKAFDESRVLLENEPTFLRAYGWYRKGVISEDPLDAFLALWNSIEIVATKYHPQVERAKNGSKSQIWESFKSIWGECNGWPIIKGNNNWIDDNYNTRINITHGKASVNIDEVEKILSRISTLKEVSGYFLKEWRKRFNVQTLS